MYPYFTRFQPEDDQRFWFYNSMHFPEPMPAFDAITAEIPYTAIGANTTRLFVLPTTLGIEHRIVNGRVYITAIPVTDPDEIERPGARSSTSGPVTTTRTGTASTRAGRPASRPDQRDRGDHGAAYPRVRGRRTW